MACSSIESHCFLSPKCLYNSSLPTTDHFVLNCFIAAFSQSTMCRVFGDQQICPRDLRKFLLLISEVMVHINANIVAEVLSLQVFVVYVWRGNSRTLKGSCSPLDLFCTWLLFQPPFGILLMAFLLPVLSEPFSDIGVLCYMIQYLGSSFIVSVLFS